VEVAAEVAREKGGPELEEVADVAEAEVPEADVAEVEDAEVPETEVAEVAEADEFSRGIGLGLEEAVLVLREAPPLDPGATFSHPPASSNSVIPTLFFFFTLTCPLPAFTADLPLSTEVLLGLDPPSSPAWGLLRWAGVAPGAGASSDPVGGLRVEELSVSSSPWRPVRDGGLKEAREKEGEKSSEAVRSRGEVEERRESGTSETVGARRRMVALELRRGESERRWVLSRGMGGEGEEPRGEPGRGEVVDPERAREGRGVKSIPFNKPITPHPPSSPLPPPAPPTARFPSKPLASISGAVDLLLPTPLCFPES
jgi:hypothetical protein